MVRRTPVLPRAPALPLLALVLTALVSVSTAALVRAHHHPAAASGLGSSVGAASAVRPVRASGVQGVAPLRHLVQPDVYIRTRSSLSAVQVARLVSAVRARSSTRVDVGTVRLDGIAVRVIGVDPAEFRGFTPPPTAASDHLWDNLAAGDAAAGYPIARARHLVLGSDVRLATRSSIVSRLGAFAEFGLPVDIVVTRADARALGLRANSGLLLSSPGRSAASSVLAVRRVLGPTAGRSSVVALHADQTTYTGKPRTYRELYQAAARTCPGLSWSVLAAIGQIESDHGVNVGPSSAGALGPMQFMPGTWAQWARDGDGDRKADIMNPYDSVYAAAAYLCWNGAGRGGASLERAIFAYNHAQWYVREVLVLAKLYR